MKFMVEWIDLVWLPVTWFAVHRNQRWVSLAFTAACLVMMRLQVDLFEYTGGARGYTGLLDWHVFNRGLAVYGAFFTFYLIGTRWSRDSHGPLLMVGAIGLFFTAMVVSTFVMAL